MAEKDIPSNLDLCHGTKVDVMQFGRVRGKNKRNSVSFVSRQAITVPGRLGWARAEVLACWTEADELSLALAGAGHGLRSMPHM